MAQTVNQKAVKAFKDMNTFYTSMERLRIETNYNKAKAEGEPEA